ncbi:DUF692 domain-containing protein [Sphingomonas sp. HITSZ_GF]|uniref:MNIO family bufferin maturase n=1 Tax=Sphingomonas sp. HITSZ_GF TaxID=3037247 RepID=UPI00240DDD21|nr:DUF692 domain-containing protein [Sphingomonas sp. HITSZ_GF]MDG2533288.1 DUF692 domain-containing protein [Sphingomonas sp. HITSZ_GF]
MTQPRLGLPNPGDGLGLREEHFPHLMATPPDQWGVDWFEAITENLLDNHGYGLRVFEHVAAHRPVVLHGVSLSIGSTAPLDLAYLAKLRDLAERFRPLWVSDHLCWTGVQGVNSHDLLPLPLTEAALAHVADRVRAVQDFLGRPLIVENPSTYLEFRASRMPEAEFLARLCDLTGCGLLLDVNNVHVSSFNHALDPLDYIEAIPAAHVVQVHLAGPSDHGTHLIDTHDAPVPDAVWPLYARVWERCGPVATMVEWDASIPPFDVVAAELARARQVRAGLAVAA